MTEGSAYHEPGAMKIHQGVDMVKASRIRDICERHGGFVSDVFTEAERQYCFSKNDPYLHLAGRFAAKEACLKALGRGLTGIDDTLAEIEVTNLSGGRPVLQLSGHAKKLGDRLGISQATVSISHTGDYAVSTVILAGEK